MKRKLLVSALAIALVAVLSVGATLAYFSAKSDVKTNTFTFGDVKIALAEKLWDGLDYGSTTPTYGTAGYPADEAASGKKISENIMPGDIAPKNPTVKNTSTANSAWIFMLVTINKTDALTAAAAKKTGGTVYGETGSVIDIVSDTTTGWQILAEKKDANAKTFTLLLGYNTIVNAGDETSAAFTRVNFYGEMTDVELTALEGLQIDVAAYAVQSTNIADLTAATAAIKSAYSELNIG